MTDPDNTTEPDTRTYIVYLTSTASCSVKVEMPVQPNDGISEDQILDAAYEDLPPGLCIHCSGGGMTRKPWTLELGDEWEPELICDAEGNELKFDGRDEADRD